jgi:transglutaminase-like putative cysteine protease
MLFTIEHETEYRFSRPVFFEPHQIRLQPRSDGTQRVLRYGLQVDPPPAGTTFASDLEGNVVTMAWFNDIHDHMVLRSSAEVETLRENPYDFLLTPANRRMPVAYEPWELTQLSSAFRRSPVPANTDPSRQLAEQIRECARGELVPFLVRLTETIANRFKVIHREHGAPWPAATTIEQRQGACRDLAVLLIDVCRIAGLAARFVSGYQEGDAVQNQRHLHAWAEVYLPGAGWRGFDPTHGLAVADRHVAVAAAVDPQYAAPVTATYRGSNVQAEMTAAISIETNVAVAAC